MKKINFLPIILFIFSSVCQAQIEQRAAVSEEDAVMFSSCSVDWTKDTFSSDVSFDVEKAGIPMPSGKTSSINKIKQNLSSLVKDPFLSLYVDDRNTLGDLVLNNTITLETVTRMIDTGKQTPAFFADATNLLKTKHSINLNDVGAVLVKHKIPYTQTLPIDEVATRKYTGIVIDARGSLPVHGEFMHSKVFPCLFPKILNENMDIVYERNMVEPQTAKQSGIVLYSASEFLKDYNGRAGSDPLWIKAQQVFGINRCDPVIAKRDYLAITSEPQNLELLKSGKVVIILDDDVLVHAVGAPEKNRRYYTAYNNIKKYFYENKVPDVILDDGPKGIQISMQNLRFIADSPELLPEEKPRIHQIAQSLKKITDSGEFSILVEGHTADVNKPNGQLTLSIQRTQTIIDILIEQGVNKDIFTYRGYGGTKPVADNSTPEGRARNRRVEITVMPKASYVQRE